MAPGGGGGGLYNSPKILVGMCRGKVKNGQGLRNGLPVERENVGSGTSLSCFELENAGLRIELEPFWAWKCESPDRAWSVLSENAYLRNGREPAALPEPAVGGDERVEIKEILKMMVSGTAKSAQKCKMMMLRNGFFCNLWKLYAPELKFRAENGGLSRCTYPICIHAYIYGSTPPPPPPPIFHGQIKNHGTSCAKISITLLSKVKHIWSIHKNIEKIAVFECENTKVFQSSLADIDFPDVGDLPVAWKAFIVPCRE